MSDEIRDLVQRCLADDESARVDLVERFRGQVFGLCYRMLRHRQDAEDVTQEAFVRVFRSLKSWDPERDFRPWLLAIAGNRCRSWLAARSRRPQSKDLSSELADDSPDQGAHRQLAEEVELALAELRDEYRKAFLLFHEQQLSYQEIADALGCPLGTVKTWVHRARREMADYLRRRGVVEEISNEL
ncbi:MAG: RNA polymerase sigma factor [Pirellulales bacterium]|nr:RNA polymerase sigma factor [Pirellulales bacterium]